MCPSMDTDRFSSLPDELIRHILSFLPRTKPSVQTSVLSKRWRFIWTRVPFLGFDYDDSRRADIITKIVLQQHKHGIHTFSIAISDRDNEIEGEFQSWIVNITTTRNILKLVIVFHGFGQLKLPQCLFTCRTVVDLWLDGCGDIPVSGIYFPALKKLKLDWVRLISHESLSQLISGCPVLEELSIHGVRLGGHCCVSSPTLTKLVLQLDNNDSRFGVNLDTPGLRYLRIHSFMLVGLSVGELDSLIEADIYSRSVLAFVGKLNNVKLLSVMDGTPVINKFAFFALDIKFHNLTKLKLSSPRLGFIAFVGKLNNVKLLSVMDRTPVINKSAFFASDIKFHNLTKLNLSSAHLGFIAFFLGNANNLRVLEFRVFYSEEYNDNEYGWKEPEQVPACLLSHLQTVELDLSCLWSFERVFDMVRYILVNDKVLKRLKVPKRWICKKKLEAFKREVALFERGSQECELVFD